MTGTMSPTFAGVSPQAAGTGSQQIAAGPMHDRQAAADASAGAPAERPAPGPLRNGNPRGNPNLAPRCGAKARTTGCPCRAPAMANGRCRMHGGNCRGPRTPEGIARMTAANTRHGNFSAPKRAEQRYVRAVVVHARLISTARRLWRYLPPDMAARLAEGPRELGAPMHPTDQPFFAAPDAMGCNVTVRPAATGASKPRKPRTPNPPPPAGRAAERLAARAEAAALAPWREAIAFAFAVKRAVRQARAARRQMQAARRNGIQREPVGACPGGGNAMNPPGLPGGDAGPAPGPAAPWRELSPLQREVMARAAGLRAHRNGPPAGEVTRPAGAEPASPGQPALPGRNGIQHEAAATARTCGPPEVARVAPALVRAAPPSPASRLTPVGGQNKHPGRIAMHRERPIAPPLARLGPKAAALRGTTHAGTWDPDIAVLIAARFGHPVPVPGWRVPQAMPATDPVAAVVRSFVIAQQHRASRLS